VNGSCLFPGNRARFPSTIGKSYDEIEVNSAKLANELGSLAGYIDAHLGHDTNGIWMQSVGFDPSRVGLNQTGLQSTHPSFGHLAAAGVAGTKKEDFQHRSNRWLTRWMKGGTQFAYRRGGYASSNGRKPTKRSFAAIFASFCTRRTPIPRSFCGYMTVLPPHVMGKSSTITAKSHYNNDGI